ncbi:hypothetical protein GIG_03637 [Mycoplasmopsis anatis 1340]|uniref:Uncharacterized protein n=1 Tax=Mycoplasmopsis anatis 1340 TaxID=1034808 RepID=F9QEB6_9BACT|nr:hypothetical protein GIG_03637 [Mycoplasmopsis anatis 1340]
MDQEKVNDIFNSLSKNKEVNEFINSLNENDDYSKLGTKL